MNLSASPELSRLEMVLEEPGGSRGSALGTSGIMSARYTHTRQGSEVVDEDDEFYSVEEVAAATKMQAIARGSSVRTSVKHASAAGGSNFSVPQAIITTSYASCNAQAMHLLGDGCLPTALRTITQPNLPDREMEYAKLPRRRGGGGTAAQLPATATPSVATVNGGKALAGANVSDASALPMMQLSAPSRTERDMDAVQFLSTRHEMEGVQEGKSQSQAASPSVSCGFDLPVHCHSHAHRHMQIQPGSTCTPPKYAGADSAVHERLAWAEDLFSLHVDSKVMPTGQGRQPRPTCHAHEEVQLVRSCVTTPRRIERADRNAITDTDDGTRTRATADSVLVVDAPADFSSGYAQFSALLHPKRTPSVLRVSAHDRIADGKLVRCCSELGNPVRLDPQCGGHKRSVPASYDDYHASDPMLTGADDSCRGVRSNTEIGITTRAYAVQLAAVVGMALRQVDTMGGVGYGDQQGEPRAKGYSMASPARLATVLPLVEQMRPEEWEASQASVVRNRNGLTAQRTAIRAAEDGTQRRVHKAAARCKEESKEEADALAIRTARRTVLAGRDAAQSQKGLCGNTVGSHSAGRTQLVENADGQAVLHASQENVLPSRAKQVPSQRSGCHDVRNHRKTNNARVHDCAAARPVPSETPSRHFADVDLSAGCKAASHKSQSDFCTGQSPQAAPAGRSMQSNLTTVEAGATLPLPQMLIPEMPPPPLAMERFVLMPQSMKEPRIPHGAKTAAFEDLIQAGRVHGDTEAAKPCCKASSSALQSATFHDTVSLHCPPVRPGREGSGRSSHGAKQRRQKLAASVAHGAQPPAGTQSFLPSAHYSGNSSISGAVMPPHLVLSGCPAPHLLIPPLSSWPMFSDPGILPRQPPLFSPSSIERPCGAPPSLADLWVAPGSDPLRLRPQLPAQPSSEAPLVPPFYFRGLPPHVVPHG